MDSTAEHWAIQGYVFVSSYEERDHDRCIKGEPWNLDVVGQLWPSRGCKKKKNKKKATAKTM
jgi:hypothetical protein